MSVKSTAGIRQEHFDDPQVGRLQIAVDKATQAARTCPIVNGVALKGITLAGFTPLDVPHRLGRAWSGWFLTSLNAFSSVAIHTPQTDTTKYLTLVANSGCVVDIWVF